MSSPSLHSPPQRSPFAPSQAWLRQWTAQPRRHLRQQLCSPARCPRTPATARPEETLAPTIASVLQQRTVSRRPWHYADPGPPRRPDSGAAGQAFSHAEGSHSPGPHYRCADSRGLHQRRRRCTRPGQLWLDDLTRRPCRDCRPGYRHVRVDRLLRRGRTSRRPCSRAWRRQAA